MENFLTCQHFTYCKGQKHLDKNLYLQLQYSIFYILSPTIIFLCPLPSLTSPRLPYHLVFSPFCPTKQTQTEEVDELPWLSSCCRVGPAFPWLIGMLNIQPGIMLAIGGIYVNPVTVSQLELSFREGFYADK